VRSDRWLVVGGQAVGQLATIIALPLLTRVLDPGPMGLYQTAFSIGIVLQPIASLRLEFMLPSVRTEAELKRLMRISTWMQVGCGALLLGVFVITTWLGAQDAGQIAIMSAMIMLAYTWTVIDNALLIRSGAVRRLAVRNLLSGSLTAGLQIATALFFPNILLLAGAVLLGRGLAISVTMERGSKKRGGESGAEERPWTITRGVFSVLSGMISSASLQGLTLYTSVGFGASSAGVVGVAQRSASAPVALLSQGLTQFAQAQISSEIRAGSKGMHRAVLLQIKAALPLAAFGSAALAVFGPLLSPVIFGPGWPEVGVIIAILALPIGLQLLVAPVMPVFIMLGHERILFIVQLIRLVLCLALAAVLHAVTGVLLLSVTGYAIGTCIGYAVTFAVIWRLLNAERRPEEG